MALTAAQALRYIMTQNQNVSAIVSSRIYSRLAPAGAVLPLGTIQTIDAVPVYELGGMSGLAHDSVQLSWYAESTSELMDLAEKARLAAGNYVGTITVGAESLVVTGVFLHGQMEDYDNPQGGEEKEAPRVIQDWSVHYKHAAA